MTKATSIMQHHWVWITLLAAVLITSAIRIRLLAVPLERDEGEYAYGGQMLLKGFLPYEPPSLYKYKLPGIYFLYAAILALFGQTSTGVHFGLLLVNLATVFLLFLLVKKLFGPLAAGATAAFYSIHSLSTSVLGLSAHAEHFVVLTAIAAVLLLLQSIESYRWWKLFFSGLLFGFAYLIRQHGAIFIIFGAVILLRHLLIQARYKWSIILMRFAIFCAAAVSPFLLTCIIFLVTGTFDKFWFWTFVCARKNLDVILFPVGMKLLGMNLYPIVISSLLIWLLALGGLVALFRNRQLMHQRFFVVTFTVLSFLAVCPGLYFRGHYFILLLPSVALLAGLGASQIKYLLPNNQWRPASGVAVALVVCMAAGQAIFYEHNIFFYLSPVSVSRAVYGTNPFPESLEIAGYIRNHSSPKDTVAIIGSEPQILFYAKRLSPTGYTDTYEMMKPYPYALQMQKEMIREIESAPPKFIVFVHSFLSWAPAPNSPNVIFDWTKRYSAQNYRRCGIVDIQSETSTTIYRWDENSLHYEPASDNWIAILERKSSN